MIHFYKRITRITKYVRKDGTEDDERVPEEILCGLQGWVQKEVRLGRGLQREEEWATRKYGPYQDSSGEEWGGAKKKRKSGGKKKKSADSGDDKPKKKKRKATGCMKPLKLSADLASIVGGDEVVTRMWDYIIANNLQDPKNMKMIRCDDKLSKVFPAEFRGFGMLKYRERLSSPDFKKI